MSGDSPISQYLEEILESGRTPEEVCSDHPELLYEVRRRLKKFKSIEAQIDDLFPSSSDAMLDIERRRLRQTDVKMPVIPGYDMQCVLGYGGMGVVYKARHVKLKRPVAVKMLLSGVYASPIERKRFAREAEAVARLSHPNVVQLHDIGECDGRPYFTMEFVQGETLARKLKGAPWPADQAVKLLCRLAQATQAAHAAGIIHRDLKPGNVLIANDGTPKIGDFGLASRVDDDATITLSGARVGTPCYMAPEQALGRRSQIGPPTDVYALGAILYELLTGRPPFRGETTTETERQLIHQDPVSPRRLNAKVPRDLDTICLKCVRKEPARRYATAAQLADDLGRFQRKEPISARRASVMERARKWVLRHPAFSVAASLGFVLAAVLIFTSVHSAIQQAQLADAIDADLRAAALLQSPDQERWPEARTELDRARSILGTDAPALLQQRLQQAVGDLNLAVTLDKIRLSRTTGGNLMVYRSMANDRYGQAFSDAHLGTYPDSPRTVAMRIAQSGVREQLIAALDDWAMCANNPPERNWVLAVVRLTDPDPFGWNQRILDPNGWNDPEAMVRLANSVPVEKVSLPLLLALAECLTMNYKDSAQYLARVQQQYPDDFWMNMVLGNALLGHQAADAREFYRAALARRPKEPVCYCAVGDTLREQGRYDEALTYYQKSLQLDPDFARGYCNIGLNYQEQGDVQVAINYYHRSLQLDPHYAWSFYNLGTAFEAQGKRDQAMDAYRKATALEPNNTILANAILGLHIQIQPPRDFGWTAWHEKIVLDPPDFDDWWGYAELSLFLGKVDDYRATRTALLRKFGDSTDPAITEKIGRACLLMPGTPDEIRQGCALIQRSVDGADSVADWIRPYFTFAKGYADYRQGKWEESIAIMRHSLPDGLGPCPQLVLSMALYQSGQQDAARKTLASAITSFDWRQTHATKRDIWFTHILRREAETMMLPNLAAFEQGQYTPANNDERLAFLGVCEFNSRNAVEAQLLFDAFAADPKLADNVRNGLRFRAARVALAASQGRGVGAPLLSEITRAAWRDRAISWLQADLIAMNKLLDQNLAGNSAYVATTLGHWKTNRDLMPIRDASAIEQLPPAEREECKSLWSDVDTAIARAQSQAGPPVQDEPSDQ
jgi:eukaryotic-like serine/threonine-protein kinase